MPIRKYRCLDDDGLSDGSLQRKSSVINNGSDIFNDDARAAIGGKFQELSRSTATTIKRKPATELFCFIRLIGQSPSRPGWKRL